MTIKLNGSTAGSVALDAPASTTGNADISFKLPVADGSANQVLKTDGSGNLGFIAQSVGIAMMDQWRITNDNTKTNNQIIDSHWERNDVYFSGIGTGMTESSGVFTFPQTGIYFILAQIQMYGGSSVNYAGIKMKASSDGGSSFDSISYGLQNPDDYSHLCMHGILDVTNTSNFRLQLNAVNNSSTQYSGGSDYHRTGLTFIRLGDT
jgi:hypothetical protein|tara:strand:+ start:293 stop:913 length:621 start_codon:yes stop_codon:yes gene_type:complete